MPDNIEKLVWGYSTEGFTKEFEFLISSSDMEKAFQKSRLLFKVSKRIWVRSTKETDTHAHWGAKGQRSSYSGQKWKDTQRRVWTSWWVRSTLKGCWSPFYILFLALWMGRVFLTRGGIFTEGRVGMYPGLHLVASAPRLTCLSPETILHVLKAVFPY